VLVSEGFDMQTAALLRTAVVNDKTSNAKNLFHEELSTRLEEIPAFRDFQANLAARILDQIKSRMHQ
jgi:hypothetical protein